MSNFNDMLTKAKEMQQKMSDIQKKIKSMEVSGSSGGDLVQVVISEDNEIKSITVKEEAKEKQEFINDLIIAAYNNARENLQKKSNEELSKLTGGISLPPGFKFPFNVKIFQR